MRPPIITVLAGMLHKATKAVPRDLGEIANLQNTAAGNTGFVNASLQRLWQGLIGELTTAYPDHGILTPQGLLVSPHHPKQATWILDGLSGQENFSRGLGHVAVSLALREASGLTLGIIFEPARGELFWAVRGGGAFLNQTRLRVSRNKEPLKALLGVYATSRDCMKSGPLHTMLGQHMGPLRLWGSPALDMAYVAAGRLDGCYIAPASFASLAAGIVIMKEAGAMVLRPGHSLMDDHVSELIAAPEAIWTWMRGFWPDMPPVRADRPDLAEASLARRAHVQTLEGPGLVGDGPVMVGPKSQLDLGKRAVVSDLPPVRSQPRPPQPGRPESGP